MAGMGVTGGVGGAMATGGSGGASGTGNTGTGGMTGGAGGAGGTAGVDPDDDGGVTAGTGGEGDMDPPVVLPSDGEALSVCLETADCNGDDLVCTVFGTYRGYCADDCTEAADCAEIDGLEPACDNTGRCVLDCAGDDNWGGGECPENMECVAVVGSLLSENFFRCQYPEPKDHDIYETCDGLRGDADCKEGLMCSVLAGLPLLSDLTLPYCAATCTEAADCDDQGSDAMPVCDTTSLFIAEGLCALECADDKDCPGDMLCFSMDLLSNRCGYAPE